MFHRLNGKSIEKDIRINESELYHYFLSFLDLDFDPVSVSIANF
jgi:hypothetical protein